MSTRRVVRRMAPAFSPEETEGGTNAAGLRFAVVCSRWNPTITERMLRSALDALQRQGARAEAIEIIRVPGAFELAAAAVLAAKRADAVIALGAIVKGETSHHDVLAHAVAEALAMLSSSGGPPIGFGLLTCDTMEQARARTDKGAEAALAAIEMANLRRRRRRR
ncbi:MAG TPA: 6,7-dimethyl-8-ribityllumazine synthase [Thermoanaerobaculia bacterium]|nr:6,7-dimethyl-8-ribityllumazine synthase [Thermoanaerobaculia bacterium]